MVLLRPAPSFSGGSGLASAAIPPAHPPTFLGTGGLPLFPPGGGCAPCTLLAGQRGVVFSPGASAALPNLPPDAEAGMGGLSRGEGAPFDCMLVTPISRISGFAGTEPLQRHYKPLQGRYRPLQSCYGAVTSRYGAVLILRAVTEWDGSKEPVPYNGIGSGPSLPRMVVRLGEHPSAPLPQGDSLWLAPVQMYATGSKEEKRAGGPLPGGTIAHPC